MLYVLIKLQNFDMTRYVEFGQCHLQRRTVNYFNNKFQVLGVRSLEILNKLNHYEICRGLLQKLPHANIFAKHFAKSINKRIKKGKSPYNECL